MTVDTRRVWLSPASVGDWKMTTPGVFHTSPACASRGYRNGGPGPVRVYLERAAKEGFEPCGICAAEIDHDFEAASYP